MSDVPQPTRSGQRREAREYDQTQLRESSHGKTVHRDYAAHYFRWVTVKEATHPGDRVLDIGCGQDQPLVKVLTYQVVHVPEVYVGVDLNPIPKKSGIRWVNIFDQFNFVEDWKHLRHLTCLPTDFAGYTKICCFEVLEHMGVAHGLTLLRAARELLAPGGTFFLSTPVFDGFAARNHLHEYTIPELTAAVQAAGLQVQARYGTFANVVKLKKVLSAEEKMLWERWRGRLGNDGLSVVFATDHPDQSRNNLWVLKKA